MITYDKQNMIQLSDTWEFYDLFDRLLCVQEVPEEKISEGLCSVSMISRIRQGERTPNKMMRDRLVARLGLADDRNENFLGYEEYVKWKLRYRILTCIEDENFAEAEKLLCHFTKDDDFNNPLEQQFYYMMQVQILQAQSGDVETIATLLEKALSLTMPSVLDGSKSLSELLLANQEINVLLEYEKYKHPEQLQERCEELLQYITNADWDADSKAKIYPKVVFYECECAFFGKPDYEKLLEHCDYGIKCLRKTEKMYYLWELLTMRERIYKDWILVLQKQRNIKKVSNLLELQEENKKWKQALETVYSLSGLQPQMKTSCYFYMQQEMYCINEVIRCRREMFGMTKKKLSEDICSEKTVGRLEKHQTKVQMPIAKLLFEKLNLSGEYQRADIVTDKPEVLEWLNEFVLAGNNYETEEALKILQNIKNHISMEIPLNKQFIHLMKSKLQSISMTSEQFFEEAKKALEYTISEQCIFQAKNLYLTNGELTCLYHMAQSFWKKGVNEYYELLLFLCTEWERNEEVGAHIGVYELLMSKIASVYGKEGDLDEADRIFKKAMLECLRYKRVNQLHLNLYCLIWLDMEREKKGIQKKEFHDIPKALESCIQLSKMCIKNYYEIVYTEKIKNYCEKINYSMD